MAIARQLWESRRSLRDETADIQVGCSGCRLQIVVFGTVSAVKTSLISALIGRAKGEDGMQGARDRQFELNSRTEFVREFFRQSFEKIKRGISKPRGDESRP